MSGKNVHATEFVPHNMSNSEPKAFNNAKKKVKDKTEKYKGEEKDPRRKFTKAQEKYIWENSNNHLEFDPEFFKKDLFGCLVVKGIKYSNNENESQKKFAYDLEHIVSHSNCGKTTVGNCALLVSGANRSKGKDECFSINRNYYVGLKTNWGIIPEDLLIELENNLHETCRKYNLVFIKNQNNAWTLKNDTFEYFQYNDEYDNDNETYFEEDFDSNPKERFESKSEKDDFDSKSEKEKPSVFNAFLLAAGAKIVTENVVLASCSVYNYTFTKTRNALYKENNTATFETTDTQKTVANIAGWSAGLYIGVSTLM
jgi:hypothetical protein